MVRSIGAARGAVVVALGAENVRLPRLPELPDMRASTETTVKASAATTAKNASNGRRVFMVFPLEGSQARLSFVEHYIGVRPRAVKGRCIKPQASFWPFSKTFGLIPQCEAEIWGAYQPSEAAPTQPRLAGLVAQDWPAQGCAFRSAIRTVEPAADSEGLSVRTGAPVCATAGLATATLSGWRQ
jgi:hypothetical protein